MKIHPASSRAVPILKERLFYSAFLVQDGKTYKPVAYNASFDEIAK
jgi:hypothetical protein